MSINELQRSAVGAVLASAALALALSRPSPAGADEPRRWTFLAEGLQVVNLIGEVRVEAAAGDRFEVEAWVRGEDAGSESLDFVVEEGRTTSLRVEFPVGEHDAFHYPNARGSVRIGDRGRGRDGTGLSDLLRSLSGDRVTVSNRSGDVEIWCDLVIRVPNGKELLMGNGVGDVHAQGVTGDVELKSAAGRINVASHKGDLVADTGSGDVTVEGVSGDIVIDTGSGDVDAKTLDGDRVTVDTGSGEVVLASVSCDELSVDTGSGDVEVSDLEARDATVDTGSGSVILTGVRCRGLSVDTGSGDVEVTLLETQPGHLDVDTGSGDIRIRLPEEPSCRVLAESSGGRVRHDVPGAEVRKRNDEFSLTVGGGDMEVQLDTGSGDINVLSGTRIR